MTSVMDSLLLLVMQGAETGIMTKEETLDAYGLT